MWQPKKSVYEQFMVIPTISWFFPTKGLALRVLQYEQPKTILMMKTTLSGFLTLFLIFSLSSCGTLGIFDDDDCCCEDDHQWGCEEYDDDYGCGFGEDDHWDDDDYGYGKCDMWATYADPGMCGGVWFKAQNGTYLEVSGFNRNDIDLQVGQRVRMSVADAESESGGLTCQAMTEFESNLHNKNVEIRKVQLTCFQAEEDDKECEQIMYYEDPGICGGMWFVNEHGEIFEVFNLPFDRSDVPFRKGEKVEMSVESYTFNGFQCEATTEYESRLMSSGKSYETVEATCYTR